MRKIKNLEADIYYWKNWTAIKDYKSGKKYPKMYQDKIKYIYKKYKELSTIDKRS